MLNTPSPTESIRVVLIEPFEMIRQSIGAQLAREPGLELAGSASTAEDARVLIFSSPHPHIVVAEIEFPGWYVGDVAQELRQRHPQMRCIALSTQNGEPLLRDLAAAGLFAYVNKKQPFAELVATIHQARHAYLPISDQMAQYLASEVENGFSIVDVGDELSERELEILTLLVQGEDNREIALHLNITLRTVYTHLTGIYAKLGVTNRTLATIIALRDGILPKEG